MNTQPSSNGDSLIRWVRLAYVPSRGRRVPCQLYDAWTNMRRRCASKLPAYWKYYGAKGIKVCSEWNDYAAFRAWALAHGFRKGLTLDRIDGGRGYSPDNCRWATWREQQLNTAVSIAKRARLEIRA
jgi:hypothetical protein